ncbi:MAG: hypothetical protein QOC66_3936 [Pseudonocardiales bacterium]|jgi:uncharacterized membrane protein YkoI|nr:hypothetical protein [Pseudonocardiales bacterium]
MTDETLQPKPDRRVGLKVALVGAGLAAGAIGATAIGANAQSTTSGTAATAQTTAAVAPTGSNDRPANRHGGAPVRGDEKAIPTEQAATLKAAALKAVPGGTVYRVETDAGDGAYEAHLTKADGTEVTVKFDKNLKVTGVEPGMGKGDPAGGPRN